MKMKGYAMLGIGRTGWIEKEVPVCGPNDALLRPIAVSPCTSDIHTVWEGAIGVRCDMILGHEAVGEVVETGSLVRDFKPGDRVIVPAITPDWSSVEAQAGYAMHSGGMLAGWKFSNIKDGVFAEYFHVNDADGNLAHLPDGLDPACAVMLSDMVPTGFHGAELAGVLISLDRQERGRGEISAIQEVERDYGCKVISIVTLKDLISYLEEKPEMAEHLATVRAYREEFGV